MKKCFFAFLTAVFAIFMTSCIPNDEDMPDVEDFQNDDEYRYTEYPDDESASDDENMLSVWGATFNFYGIINDGNSDNIDYGSGILTYLNLQNESVSVSAASWAIKKTLTINSGHQVPIIQIFFADNASNVDEEGRVLYFILQLEGSSVSSKSETYYLNNDKLYKARVKLNAESGKIEEICYLQEPDPTKGKVNIYTSNIRIGEELRVDGYADMLDMEIKECKTMN